MPVTTIVFSGGAVERAPAILRETPGASLRISDVVISDHVSYAQHSPRHLVNLPLSLGGSRSGAARAISFAPADRERRGRTAEGQITGLQIGFEDWFLEAACEETIRASLEAGQSVDSKAIVMAEAVAALGTAADADRIAYDTLLIALARRLGRAFGKASRRRDDGWLHPRALARVIESLRSQPAGSARLDNLAEEAGLGVSAFIRAFRGSVGITPAAFALRMRLDEAARLLASTDLPVARIAKLCGFSSASHFVDTFRASRGETPSRWRKGAKGGRVA